MKKLKLFIFVLQKISNADFWQLAGIVALENGNEKLGKLVKITFKGGRIDCPTSSFDNADHVFPDPSMNRTIMLNWFKDTRFGFGMNENEVESF